MANKGTASRPRSAVASAAATAASTAVVSIAAGLAGVLLAQKLGRNAETDGFLAAYAVYLLLVLAAQAVRVTVLPELTRASAAGRLGAELASYALALMLAAVPALLVSTFLANEIAAALTSSLPDEATEAASGALVWLVPAAVLQLAAVLAASALAALDEYVAAALGFAASAVVSLGLFLLLVDEHGAVALAWGLAAGGVVALAAPLAALLLRGGLRRSGVAAPRRLLRRLGGLGRGAVLPLAVQGLYLVALWFAGDLGVGRITSLSYAYFAAAFLVSATASSLALVSSVPLTRSGLEGDRAAGHVVSVAWLSLPVIAAAAGLFAVAGEEAIERVLGDAFAGGVGSELARLIVVLGPWMVFSVGVSVAFPLLFVSGATRSLPALAVAAVAIQVPLCWLGRELLGLPGLAIALAATTALVLAGLLAALSARTVRLVVGGLVPPTLWSGVAAGVAFGLASLVPVDAVGAALGLAAYVGFWLLARPRGLREAWAYMRALH